MNTFALNTLQKKLDRLNKSKLEYQTVIEEYESLISEAKGNINYADSYISDLLDAIRVIEAAYAQSNS